MVNNYTEPYDNLFTYEWSSTIKSRGNESSKDILYDVVSYENGTSSNFSKLPWIDDNNKKFYYYLRTPVLKNLSAFGLLYTSNITQYVKIKAYFCSNLSSSVACLPPDNITYLSNYGRFFLFIEN